MLNFKKIKMADYRHLDSRYIYISPFQWNVIRFWWNFV